MKHSDYWRGRFEALNESLLREGMDCYDDIERAYRQAMQRIEKDITVWYQRLAANNDVSFAAAKKLLSANELEEFRWSVDQYIKKGKENAVNQRWIKQMENASAKVHISRLEAIKLQLQQHLEVLYGNQLDGMDKAMRKLYQAGYYHAAFEVQRGIGVGFDFMGIDETRLQKILTKPWAADGKNFSDRIWQSKAQLINALHTELTQATIRGDPPERPVRAVAKKMNTSLSNAGRLVMTESAFFAAASQRDCFDELGVERYEIIATLDLKTSPICREMDGKVFKQSDYKPGVTAPPLHCWCRSCTAPYFEDNPGVRAARGEDGKTHHVPADMHYEDWYKVYVDKTVKPDEWRKSREKDIIKKTATEKLKAENFPPAFTEKSELKNTRAFVDYVNNLEGADANVVALYNRMGKMENIESQGIPFKISHAKSHALTTMSYRATGKLAEAKLTIPKLQGDNLVGQINTILHEEMHLIDFYNRRDPQKSGPWYSVGRQSLADCFKTASDSIGEPVAELFRKHDEQFKKVYDDVSAEYRRKLSALSDSYMNRTFGGSAAEYRKACAKLKATKDEEINYRCRNIMGGGIGNLQDIYDALSGGGLRDRNVVLYGHGSAYYQQAGSRVQETIANYAALSVTRPDLIDLLRADKPELVAELDAAIKDLLEKVGEKDVE